MSTSHPWQAAASLAARAHRHQLRQDGKTPYAAHPTRVALTLVCVFGCTDESILAAALLHDVLEDTDRDYDDIEKGFGKEIADLVAVLSKDGRMPEPEREAAYHDGLRSASWQAKLIKLADAYDNLMDAVELDPAMQKKKLPRRLLRAEQALSIVEDEAELREAANILRKLKDRMQHKHSVEPEKPAKMPSDTKAGAKSVSKAGESKTKRNAAASTVSS